MGWGPHWEGKKKAAPWTPSRLTALSWPLPPGTPGTESCFVPQNLTSFKNSTKSWVGFSGGQHHTVCMDSEGRASWSISGLEVECSLGTGLATHWRSRCLEPGPAPWTGLAVGPRGSPPSPSVLVFFHV